VKKAEERAFVAMCALDQAAMKIHPSIRTKIPGRTSPAHTMLSAMRTERTMTGAYFEIPQIGFVLPKGGLLPGVDRVNGNELSGTFLGNQFSFLSFLAQQTKIAIRPKTFPPNR
ncbi:hypothetical protein R0K19_21720, partial [Bacillus sp. SIMBA_161]